MRPAKQRKTSKADPGMPTDLTFITFTSPFGTKQPVHRRQIRSHVTRRQHEQKGRGISRPHSDLPEDEEQRHGHAADDEGVEGGVANSSAQSTPSACLSETAKSPVATAFSKGTSAFQTFALDDSDNEVGAALAKLGVDASGVLKFYEHIVKVQAKDIQTQYSTGEKSSSTSIRFLTFMFSDPILLVSAIIIGARSLPKSSEAPRYPLLLLQDFLVARVNTALGDERRALCNQMLVCISLLATSAVKQNDFVAYHTHMSGLVQMVRLRGGLQQIGMEIPWIQRLIVWFDVNASSLAGTEPYHLQMGVSPTLGTPKAHRETFTL